MCTEAQRTVFTFNICSLVKVQPFRDRIFGAFSLTQSSWGEKKTIFHSGFVSFGQLASLELANIGCRWGSRNWTRSILLGET